MNSSIKLRDDNSAKLEIDDKICKSYSYLYDDLISNYYKDHFYTTSSKQLDSDFNRDMKMLTKVLSEISESDRKAFIHLFSKVLEFYIENKLEKEIDQSFYKILKF